MQKKTQYIIKLTKDTLATACIQEGREHNCFTGEARQHHHPQSGAIYALHPFHHKEKKLHSQA